MNTNSSTWDITKTLMMGPGRFILGYGLIVLSPLFLVRVLNIEHREGQFDFAVATGLVAYMIFITVFFFSGRFEWLNGKRGMDLMLKFHRRIVFFALVLVIAHIALIAPLSMPNLIWPVMLAFFLIVAMIVMAKIRSKIKLKYEIWRLSHGFFAVVILGLIGFHALSEGGYSSHPIVAIYLGIFTLLAIFSLPYVHVYKSIKARKNPYIITQITHSADQQWTIEIEPESGEAIDFLPGQFAFVAFNEQKKPQFHPFSFSSAPSARPKIAFTIKEVGDFTHTVGDIKLGAKVYLDGPYGYMTRDLHRGPENRGKGLVLLAGGIGITPMISMLREMKSNRDQDPVKLFYGCRYEEDLLYKEELEDLKSELNLEVHILLSQPNNIWPGEVGRLDSSYLNSAINFPHFNEYLYFSCGTTDFVKDTVKSLENIKGIPFFNIRYENFSVYN